jgi:hypothetical protein
MKLHCEHVELGDLHATFFFHFFNILKHDSNVFQIKGAYVQERQNTMLDMIADCL